MVIDCTDTSNVPVTNLLDNNEEWRVEHRRKCDIFNKWCHENGMKTPKLEYPAYFEGGLVGVRALEQINHREAFISVPYKMLITVDGA